MFQNTVDMNTVSSEHNRSTIHQIKSRNQTDSNGSEQNKTKRKPHPSIFFSDVRHFMLNDGFERNDVE